ncbi:HNH endonuclease signature motif containing protein [Microbacterium sp. BK668]|uniref:HNH endonuclease signature motif containing protein n=1 Tax=Microbacterium sp. BK668 TaxID=2512118 RepID=UPI0010EE39D5|nr:HNH endonuclease signature motif containing protein [Microbacterium sp. BK668]TDN93226.1 uncharacterized protein DUF222 [Microbacterium sp. BK668]
MFTEEHPPVPDAIDLVVEVADMMSVIRAQQYARVDAMRREALDEAGRYGRGSSDIAERSLRLELAAALRVTEYAAAELVRLAEALVHRYPEVLDSLSHAGMTERHATVLVDVLDEIEPELAAELVREAIALAEAEPVGTFRRKVRALVEAARSETLAERHERALSKRRVFVDPGEDGMAFLGGYLPAVEAHAAFGRLTAMAKVIAGSEGEARTLDQIRADILGDLLIDGGSASHPEQARGIRATVFVTVPALALLEEGAATDEPAVVEGVGPVPVDRARELAGGDGAMMRILTHPETGMVLSVGRDRYETPAWLRKLVQWRADRCQAPGCSMPASRCQIDHSIAWEHGGATALWNLGPLCQGHHTVKHHGGWVVTQLADGSLEWISPSGRRYVVRPERRVPVFRPTDAADAPF